MTQPITIYTRNLCSFCTYAKKILVQKNVEFTEINIDINPSKFSEMKQRSKGKKTVPQIFIGAIHIGGCDDLVALNEAGKLNELLSL